MKGDYLKDIHEEWRKVGKYKSPEEYELELAIYKKMLDVFQVGDYYHFIFVPPVSEIEFVSDDMVKVLGYTKEEFDIDLMMSIIHSDDLPYFLDFERSVVEFKTKLTTEQLLKYKTRYDYRIRKKNGDYIRVLQQSTTIQADEGAVIRNLIVHTDISHLKTDPKMELSFIGLEGEPSFINVKPQVKYIKQTQVLTKREREVLALISKNKTTEEIAEALFISPQTVSTHRKNIMAKAETSSALELVMKALKCGWI